MPHYNKEHQMVLPGLSSVTLVKSDGYLSLLFDV